MTNQLRPFLQSLQFPGFSELVKSLSKQYANSTFAFAAVILIMAAAYATIVRYTIPLVTVGI